jgi:hypothetical protein
MSTAGVDRMLVILRSYRVKRGALEESCPFPAEFADVNFEDRFGKITKAPSRHTPIPQQDACAPYGPTGTIFCWA